MTTYYARSDVRSYHNPSGCGKIHATKKGGLSISCAACEPYLARDPHFGTDAADLPQTPDELAEVERVEKLAERLQAEKVRAEAKAQRDEMVAQIKAR